jgi:hypothetical protein
MKAVSYRSTSYGMKGCSLIDKVLIIIFRMVERTLISLKSEIEAAMVALGGKTDLSMVDAQKI